MVLHPAEFVVLLKLYEVPSFCVVCGVWVDEGWFFEPGAVEAAVSGKKAHFFLVGDEREVAMAATPCRCVKVARKGGELLNERADGGKGWLAEDQLVGMATIRPHTILVMAVTVVVMDAIIYR